MRRLLMIFAALAGLNGCGEQAPKSVQAAVVRLAAVPGNPAAAYFTVHAGPVDDRLMSVSSPLVLRAEMHDMKMDGAMMSMTPLTDGVPLKAGESVAFASGGKHVMLFDVSPRVQPGRKMPLTLTFASGATLEAYADIKAAGQE
jgi:periplasmic copper chaperone A